jgi:TetR/AcrR family transcriptional regulator
VRSGTEPTKQRVLRAAAEEFAARGVLGARLESIARKVGIRRPSLLHHFGTREELYRAVVRDVFDTLARELVATLVAQGSFGDRVEATARRFEAVLAAQPTIAPLIVRELLDRRGFGARVLEREIVPLLKTLERVARRDAKGSLRPGVPFRAALVQVAGNLLLESATGELRRSIWGPGRHASRLARSLFVREE